MNEFVDQLRFTGYVCCSMKSYRLSELSSSQVDSLKSRPRIDFSSIFATVTFKLFFFFFVDHFPTSLIKLGHILLSGEPDYRCCS